MKKELIKKILFIFIVSIVFVGCYDDKFDKTIFDDKDELDPTSETYVFDLWLEETYRKPFNLEFRYKMKDISSDMSYNLVPAYFEKSEEMAKIIKYLWYDAYASVASNKENFLKLNGPKIIQLIGSPAYNPASQTRVLGLAEGGIMITLFDCNSLDRRDITSLNTYYFNTMHHEFAHVLHQKKMYPKDFDEISKGNYNPVGWQNRTDKEVNQLGFVTKYAGSQPAEDFVETISHYIVLSDKDWEDLLNNASNTAYEVDGKDIILSKLDMCRSWLRDSWEIEIDSLRKEVKVRQENLESIFN